jgi:hypothetical protein
VLDWASKTTDTGSLAAGEVFLGSTHWRYWRKTVWDHGNAFGVGGHWSSSSQVGLGSMPSSTLRATLLLPATLESASVSARASNLECLRTSGSRRASL